MKNKMILIPVLILAIAIGTGTMILIDSKHSSNSRFKKEYGESVPKGTSIVYLTNDEIIEAFDTDDKLVFIGSPSSDDTKKAISTLLTSAKNNGIDKIYYFDATETKDKTNKKLLERLNKKEIIMPTLFLIKDKKTNEIQEGITNNLQEKYDDIMIAYIMCTTPDC
ncbi:MAG: hypothetical protein IJL74_01445 [Bacilli bacterium]|nr:hypothetical protein [Bacilli bacterium]